ncbi:MAG: sigma 54-interacting transcriptional regulator [Myxococcota bacterium]|nr:sigma 54-interacting transcriptional regulator [Myxococcota bacterium]
MTASVRPPAKQRLTPFGQSYTVEEMRSVETRASVKPFVVKYTKTRILVVEGPDAGACLEIAGSSTTIGTAADNGLVLHDDTVSREHCEIESIGEGVRVRDRGSTNGVFASGMRIFDVILTGAQTLTLGATKLALTPLEETVDRLQASTARFGDVIGASPRARELFADLERIAATELTLLIEGETGTGKDVVAESVHRASARGDGPFIVFDCGAVASNLAESELFGHERGAFTGAVSARPGVFEAARGGTVFLDEIGELPKELQPKLLRVLEKREVRRLGSMKTLPVEVRIIAATNRNLHLEVERGTFRQDLYFRLAAAHVCVPPLRERMSDLPLLVEHFLSLEVPPRHIDEVRPEVWELLRAHRWPGNVRELRNAVQRLLVTPDRIMQGDPAANATLSPSAADESSRNKALLPLRVARREASDAFERGYLMAALSNAGGNISKASRLAEVSRQMLSKLMRKHGMATSAIHATAEHEPKHATNDLPPSQRGGDVSPSAEPGGGPNARRGLQ